MKYVIRILFVVFMGTAVTMTGCKQNNEQVEQPDYEAQIQTLEMSKDQLSNEIRILEASIEQLTQSNTEISARNELLQSNLDQLQEEYQLFLEPYDTLSDGYVELFRDYNYLLDDYNELEGAVETEAVNRSKIVLPEAFAGEMVFNEAVVVSNATELMNAIGSHVHIVLNDGIYDFASVNPDEVDNPNITISQSGSNYILSIDFIQDLLIEGTIYGVSTISGNGTSGLISFNSCTNIMIKNINLEMGNDIERSDVMNNLRFNDCDGVYVDKSNIQGHGITGVLIESTDQIYVNDSIISDCLKNGIEYNDSKELVITHSIIRNCDDGAILNIGSSGLYIYESELDGEYITSY